MMVLLLLLVAIAATVYPSVTQAVDSSVILLANHGNIQFIPVAQPDDIQLVASGLKQAIACDYIYEDRLIFWMDAMDYGKGKIQSVNISGTSHNKTDVLRTGLSQPDGLSCDWIGKKLYWTDAETNRIEVSELDGRSRKVLIWDNLDQPRAIAVDPNSAYMYWTDWGEIAKIERAGMDGSRRQVLVDKNIYWPNGITLDYDEGKVYWVEANYHFIHRMNMDGSQREEVITSSTHVVLKPTNKPPILISTTSPATNRPALSQEQVDEDSKVGADLDESLLQHPFAISLHGDRIYWTDWATYSIHSTLKNGSGVPTLIKDHAISPMDLQIYSADRQMPGPNPCRKENGGCSHLCLLSPDPPFYRCACPTGVRILEDQKTCKNGPNEILVVARRDDLRVISLDTTDHTSVLVPVNSHAVAVEFDPVDKYVYWSDDGEKAILRAHLNGSGYQSVISDSVEQCDGIAIDWVARNLYWTDTGRDFIAVSRLNGTSRKILIKTDIDEPRAIVLDPVAGHMYWTDWGNHPKIERANLDGSKRIILVSTNIKWPNGLTIDANRSLLFWGDAGLDRIEMIHLNGTKRKILLSEGIPHIFGLSLLDDYLYWTDWQRRRIERMRIGDRKSREILIEQLPDMMGVKASSLKAHPGTNICAEDNGGCSHLCLFSHDGEKCHCPNGMDLSPDMKTCVVPEVFLLFSFTNDVGIHKISLDTARGDALVPFDAVVDASFLDFSASDNKIYWTNTRDMTILRSFLNGTEIEIFIDVGIEMLEGLAVDWIGRNVYWADSSTNRIEVASMDRTSRKAVVWEDIESPRCLALDPSNGYIYWSEWGSEPCIKRAEMDGSHVVQIMEKGTTGRANSLTIDYNQQRLYWVDFEINVIVSTDMNGNDHKDVIAGMSSRLISSLALYGSFIFWSDSKHQSIEQANKITAEERRVIKSGLGDIDDVLVYHASRQSGVTACSHDNGGCEHLCLSLPNGRHTCSCPAQYILNADNTTCTAPANFLLISQGSYVSRITFHLQSQEIAVIPGKKGRSRNTGSRRNGPLPSPDAVLPIRGMVDACSLDYDPIEERLYWLDCYSGDIRSSFQNGSEMRIILKGNNTLHQPYDFALDPYSKLMYWTDALSNAIKITKFNGAYMGVVLSKSNMLSKRKKIDIMPRKIALDPFTGRLFFSNTCKNTHICRCKIIQTALDGSDFQVLFRKGLRNVTALAVDRKRKRLYWADDQGFIESSTMTGTDQKKLVQTVLKVPIGLTVFGQDMFWIDPELDSGLIEGANKMDGDNRRKIQSRMKNLRDITSSIDMIGNVFARYPCSNDNGGCSHLCVPEEDGTTRCSCPNHLELVDEFNCKEPMSCGPDKFTCRVDHQCVPASWRCNKEIECDDGTDEMGCPYSCEDKFMCGKRQLFSLEEANFLDTAVEASTQCFPMERRCDGIRDCIDGSDEASCCEDGRKRCDSGDCVSSTSLCQSAATTSGSGGNGSSSALVIAGSVIGSSVFLVMLGLFLRCCMLQSKSRYPSGVFVVTPNSDGRVHVNLEFQPNNETTRVLSPAIGSHKKTTSFNLSIAPPGSSHGSGRTTNGWPLYKSGKMAERPVIPGASSTSSTKRSLSKSCSSPSYQCSDDYMCSSSSYYRCKKGHKHRKQHVRPSGHGPPPPTPCTTDTCEDFEGKSCLHSNSIPHEPPPPYYRHHSCCCHCHHQHNTRHHHASSSTSMSSRCCGDECGETLLHDWHRHHRKRNRYLLSELTSDSDPYAPPPTPRSQYMSENCDTTEVEDAIEVETIIARIIDASKEEEEEAELLARSSSPSFTERSYCIYNPPPSPVTD